MILVTDPLLRADEALFVLFATMLVQAVRVVEVEPERQWRGRRASSAAGAPQGDRVGSSSREGAFGNAQVGHS
jgi:hypothetical protein